MPARRRHYPGRGPLTGTAGTRAAYDSCRTCGHARNKHLTSLPQFCTGLVYVESYDHPDSPDMHPEACPCPGFSESEE